MQVCTRMWVTSGIILLAPFATYSFIYLVLPYCEHDGMRARAGSEEVKGQLCGVTSLLPLRSGFLELNSGHQTVKCILDL